MKLTRNIFCNIELLIYKECFGLFYDLPNQYVYNTSSGHNTANWFISMALKVTGVYMSVLVSICAQARFVYFQQFAINNIYEKAILLFRFVLFLLLLSNCISIIYLELFFVLNFFFIYERLPTHLVTSLLSCHLDFKGTGSHDV